ncbi:MAG: hypothetical protein EOM74_00930 [Methanomicrobia archaeon]|nr:hypothetical protein [Methanomicrobia archaeon]
MVMEFGFKLQLAYEKIVAAKRVLLVSHTSPDADAISSLGAMIEITRSLGVPSDAYSDRKSKGTYSFIPNEELISANEPVDLNAYEVILILDCGSLARTNLEGKIRELLTRDKRPYLIEFDHHEPQETFADLEIRDASRASTTEIIYQLLKASSLPITKTLADCILIGLVTDTGHFLHANSSREALAVSSEMLLRGASLPKILDKTIHNKSFSTLKVWGKALENMKFDAETGLASSALSSSELKEILSPEERENHSDLFGDIVAFLSCLAGVTVALLLREDEGRIKGSLRTNSEEIDVAEIARKWGGGGHKKAAGFALFGKLVATDKGWKVIKS